MQQDIIINRLYSVVCHLSSVLCSLSSVFRLLSSAFLYICREPSTNHLLFMQNKPNFRKSQMNVYPYNTMDYENKWQRKVRKNKPNSNPISERPKMNVNAFLQKDYENETAFALRRNKPNQSQSDTLLLCGALLHSTH